MRGPLVLWLRGTEDLKLTCVNSVAIVGSRAATGYGQHVAIELAAVLAERGVATVSGGAYGTLSQPRTPVGCDRRDDLSCRRAHASRRLLLRRRLLRDGPGGDRQDLRRRL